MKQKSLPTDATASGTSTPAESVAPLATARAAQAAPAPVRHTSKSRMLAVASVAVLVIAMLAFPRRPLTPASDDEGVRAHSDALSAAAAATGAPSAPVVRRASSARAAKAPAARPEKNHVAESATSGARAATVAPAADNSTKDAVATKLAGSDANGSQARASVAPVSAAAPVTLTGCLEVSVDQDEFRLTEVDGVDAPRSRSWRTGFLKKQPVAVALVEPPESLALQTHVGRRITATGLLSSHDLKVSALRAVGPPCN